ncbi:MAG: NAD(P)/FAD-dependent oxidoreductase [Candidatus Aenigmarchaeota archaeon]|nr:NAD(P)/FAD-dependent oxidoreductase [Candidatus Aenigmarchaeota archaeon]
MIYDVVVVGAGPVGCKTAELITKKGFKVLVLEEHPEVGAPVQCSGLVSHRIFKLSGASKDVIVNRVKGASFYCKENCVELKSKKTVYVIDREKFDKEMAEKSENSGAKIKTSTKFENYKKIKNYLDVKTNKGNFQTKILIGCDGPNSTVARAAKIKLPDNVLTGIQVTAEYNFDPDKVELWFGSKICPDFFGWVIPENEKFARVGLASSKKVAERFDNFIKIRLKGKIKFKNKLAGPIRYGLIENSISDNVILVGDAACHIKPFSGGGIIYSLIGAKFAAEACVKSLEEENYSSEFFKENYDNVWKNKLAWPIKKGLFMKNSIHSFSDWQLSLLFSMINVTKIKKLLEFTDMDLL